MNNAQQCEKTHREQQNEHLHKKQKQQNQITRKK